MSTISSTASIPVGAAARIEARPSGSQGGAGVPEVPSQPETVRRPDRAEPGSPLRPHTEIDGKFVREMIASGWQGKTILAGGGDIEDQSILCYHKILEQPGQGTPGGLGGSALRWMKRHAPFPTDGSHRDPKECGNTLFLRKSRGAPASSDTQIGPVVLEMFCKLTPAGDRKVISRLAARAHREHPIHHEQERTWRGTIYTTSEFTSSQVGKQIEVPLGDGIVAYYTPWDDDSPYSSRGSLILRKEQFLGSPDEVRTMLTTLSEQLGITGRLSTDEDLEFLYLMKMCKLRKLHPPAFPRTARADEKILLLKRHLEERLGIADLHRLPNYDFRPRFHRVYNPGSSASGLLRGGWAYWTRFDFDEDTWRPFVASDGTVIDTVVFHQFLGSPVGEILRHLFDATGTLVCMEERLRRLGCPIMGLGGSPDVQVDRQTGGAGYVYGRIASWGTRPSWEGERVGHGIRLCFDARKLLRRADWIAHPHPGGGATDLHGDTRPSTDDMRLTVEELRDGKRCDELMFKHDIPLIEYLTSIEIGKDVPGRRRVRRHVISALAAQGITTVNGKRLADLVRVG